MESKRKEAADEGSGAQTARQHWLSKVGARQCGALRVVGLVSKALWLRVSLHDGQS